MELDCAFVCNTRLSLGLGCNSPVNRNDPPDDTDDHHQEIKSKPSSGSAGKSDYGNSFPSLTLALPSDHRHTLNMDPKSSDQQYSSADHTMHGRHQASSGSAVSSFSNSSVKREVREVSGGDQEEVEEERISQKNIADPEQDEEGPRKKLRLTKEQSLILEDSFKEHSTLNPKQKQALANKLNLRPRQVEVWFQNRRARTKLKQTEVDFEMLKKCCETLKEENKKLHKELQELKAMKLAMPPTPFYMQLPAATLTMCPSCETISASGGAGENSSKISFSIGATKPHFYTPFINPSPSAC